MSTDSSPPSPDHLAELKHLVATLGPTNVGTCDAGAPDETRAALPVIVNNHFSEPKVQSDKSMNRDKPELPAYILAIIAIVCIAALTFHGDHVPEVLNLVTIGALGIGGAVTTPGAKS